MSSSNSMPVPAAPLDDEDLLQETLLCLPPQPSSLPRTSLVCPRWHRILSYPKFLTRFRRQHKVPPLLGFLAKSWGMPTVFKPVDPPYHIPTERFSVPKPSKLYASWDLLGLAVLVNMWQRRQIIVWDPLSGQQHRVNFPPGLDNNEVAFWHASVMCADDQDGHVHGDCFSSPFRLVLIWVVRHNQASACLHESASAVWGEIVMEITDQIYFISPGFDKRYKRLPPCLSNLVGFHSSHDFRDASTVTTVGGGCPSAYLRILLQSHRLRHYGCDCGGMLSILIR